MDKDRSQSSHKPQDGSIELIVVGLLAALLVVLALPLFLDPPNEDENNQSITNDRPIN